MKRHNKTAVKWLPSAALVAWWQGLQIGQNVEVSSVNDFERHRRGYIVNKWRHADGVYRFMVRIDNVLPAVEVDGLRIYPTASVNYTVDHPDLAALSLWYPTAKELVYAFMRATDSPFTDCIKHAREMLLQENAPC